MKVPRMVSISIQCLEIWELFDFKVKKMRFILQSETFHESFSLTGTFLDFLYIYNNELLNEFILFQFNELY